MIWFSFSSVFFSVEVFCESETSQVQTIHGQIFASTGTFLRNFTVILRLGHFLVLLIFTGTNKLQGEQHKHCLSWRLWVSPFLQLYCLKIISLREIWFFIVEILFRKKKVALKYNDINEKVKTSS